MNTKLFHFFSILIIVSMIGFTACKKSEENEPQEDNQEAFDISKDIETTENQFYDVYNIALDALDGELDGSRSGRTESCATITHVEDSKTFTIDFGTNCVGQDGRTRSGKMIINYRDRNQMTRDELAITFENYTVNTYVIDGTLRTNGISKNAADQWEYSLKLENGTVVFPDHTIQLAFERLYTWTEGIGSLDYTDDVFTVTGNSAGVTTNGVAFTSSISTPLIRTSVCLTQQITYPVSGIINIQFTSKILSTVILDYGNGACDKEATLTVGNQTTTINLP
jgi:hypothetical protein